METSGEGEEQELGDPVPSQEKLESYSEKSVALWSQVDPNVSDSARGLVIGADGACGGLVNYTCTGSHNHARGPWGTVSRIGPLRPDWWDGSTSSPSGTSEGNTCTASLKLEGLPTLERQCFQSTRLESQRPPVATCGNCTVL